MRGARAQAGRYQCADSWAARPAVFARREAGRPQGGLSAMDVVGWALRADAMVPSCTALLANNMMSALRLRVTFRYPCAVPREPESPPFKT